MTPDAQARALKPCPFCGGEAEVRQEGNTRVSCIMGCTECGCELHSNENGAGYYWNLRASRPTWTDKKPTEVGWYALRAPKYGWRDFIVWVESDEEGGLYIQVDDTEELYVLDVVGQWARIEMPQEEQP